MTHSAPPPQPAGRVRREAVLAVAGGIVLACLLRQPVLRNLSSGVAEDLGDPLLQAWQLAWGREALLTQPLSPFDANTFWPLENSLAFSDSLLGYAPLGLLFGAGTGSALLRYNVIFLLTYALAFTGTYALVRQLGASRTAGGLAGLAFAYAPWHLAQEGHLQILSSGGIPLALALLARGHGYGRPGPHRQRPALVLAGWAVAAWQVTLGFGLGLQLGYLLGILSLVYGGAWLARGRSPRPGARLAAAEAGGMALFLLVAVAFALPYLAVAEAHPEARRTVADLQLFSPPARAFFTAPADSLLYGDAHTDRRAGLGFPPEMTLAVGGTLVVLAVAGLVVGRWPLRRRLGLAVAVVVLAVLAMGTQFAGGGRWTYLLLYEHAPGWEGIRTPGRLVVSMTLALALLAAAGLDRLREAVGGPRRAHVVGALAVALVGLETLGTTPVLTAPRLPAALSGATGPVLVLPTDAVNDLRAMYFSTAGLYPLVNGYSGFTPTALSELRADVAGFPDAASVRLLRERGVRQVVLLQVYAGGTAWAGAADRPVDGLPLARRLVGDAVVYELAPLR
ncbi:MAG: hypothetical protein ACR2K2_16065 [Mycobacteriales bacterium]